MNKRIFSFNINGYTEKALKDYCSANNMETDEFLEEAIMEKLEAEELYRSELEAVTAVEAAVLEEGLSDPDGDLYKKKH